MEKLFFFIEKSGVKWLKKFSFIGKPNKIRNKVLEEVNFNIFAIEQLWKCELCQFVVFQCDTCPII